MLVSNHMGPVELLLLFNITPLARGSCIDSICVFKVFLKNTLLQNKNRARYFSKVPCIYFQDFLKNTFKMERTTCGSFAGHVVSL